MERLRPPADYQFDHRLQSDGATGDACLTEGPGEALYLEFADKEYADEDDEDQGQDEDEDWESDFMSDQVTEQHPTVKPPRMKAFDRRALSHANVGTSAMTATGTAPQMTNPNPIASGIPQKMMVCQNLTVTTSPARCISNFFLWRGSHLKFGL